MVVAGGCGWVVVAVNNAEQVAAASGGPVFRLAGSGSAAARSFRWLIYLCYYTAVSRSSE